MKSPINVDFLKTTNALKIVVFFFISFTFFYLGKHWSDGYQQLIFFTQNSDPDPNQNPNSAVSISPNFNKDFNISTLIDQEKTLTQPPPPSPPPPSPPPSDSVEKFGIVNENGTMSEEFEIGSFDPAMVDDWVNETQVEKEGSESVTKFAIKKFGLCSRGMSEYIPCLDNVEAIKKLPSTEKGERFERHCPEDGKKLNCLVPAPKGYRAPIPWPKSRDEVKISFLLFLLSIKLNGCFKVLIFDYVCVHIIELVFFFCVGVGMVQ